MGAEMIDSSADAAEKGLKGVPQADKGADADVAIIEAPEDYFGEVRELSQGLQQRHVQMIALAGAIGTGLFLGSGSSLAKGGPLGAFLGYTFTGILASSIALAVGEMGSLVPLSGGIVRYAELWADPALSFAVGWNIVYFYLVSIPNEIVAAAVLIEFWASINNAIVSLPCFLLLLASFCVLTNIYPAVGDRLLAAGHRLLFSIRTRVRRARVRICYTEDRPDCVCQHPGLGGYLRRRANG